MNALKSFENKIGGRWTGIIFHRDDVPDENMPDRPMRFCEAIRVASKGPLTLTKDKLNCPGALRSFGWEKNGCSRLVANLAERNDMAEEAARELMDRVPSCNGDIRAITIGSYESPDVVVSYAQPEATMRLISGWQKKSGMNLDVTISSVMAVCGWVAARSYLTEKMCISFGCPESRTHGSIGNDRLIIGLPATDLESFRECE